MQFNSRKLLCVTSVKRHDERRKILIGHVAEDRPSNFHSKLAELRNSFSQMLLPPTIEEIKITRITVIMSMRTE